MTTNPQTAHPAAHALFAGGGTGGHVFPGLAVAEELGRRGWRVSWAGAENGLERRLVTRRELPFHALAARPVVGQGAAGKARALLTLARSAWDARGLVRRLDARVVLGTGGYVSAPAVVGARLAARPVLLLEPNAEPGLANRWLSRLASGAAVAFDETRDRLHCPARTTGVPVREEFFAVARALPPTPPWRLLVLGGSQGARQINELMPAAVATLAASGARFAVLHQAGERHVESTRDAYARALDGVAGAEVTVEPFLTDVAGAMAGSHLVVSRAGAITLAEICAAGRPSLLVPLMLAEAHQVQNARRLEDAGASRMLEKDAAAADLARLLDEVLADGERLAAMAAAARGLARRDAAAAIAEQVIDLGEETR